MPQLRESIESINEQLVRDYGKAFNGQSNFRIVWSEDQLEKRWTDKTDEGFDLLNAEVRTLPKYRQYVQEKYVLERLVPVLGETDLTTNISYEPAWVFEDKHGNYLPPRFDMCKFVIDAIVSQINSAGTHQKYKDPDVDPEYKKQQITDMESKLFGDETPVGDALTHGSGIVVPGNSSGGDKSG